MAEPSVSSGIFESLFNLYLVIALLVGGAVIGWLLLSLWRYRARPDSPRPFDAPVPGVLPAERGRVIWSWVLALGIAAIMFGLAFSTISAVDALERPPTDRVWDHHNVTGFQFGWKYNYTGAGGIPFQTVNEWTVPAETVVVLNITSQDVWHNFAIVPYRIRVDAIPGEVNTLWFEAKQTGVVSNVCVQLCGSSHANMKTSMTVLPAAEYQTWLAQRSTEQYGTLENNIFKDAKRGTVANVTFSGGALESGTSNLVPGRPVVFNVTNEGSAPETFTATANGARTSVTVPPGGSARLWSMAPASGSVVLSASSGPSADFKVVSP